MLRKWCFYIAFSHSPTMSHRVPPVQPILDDANHQFRLRGRRQELWRNFEGTGCGVLGLRPRCTGSPRLIHLEQNRSGNVDVLLYVCAGALFTVPQKWHIVASDNVISSCLAYSMLIPLFDVFEVWCGGGWGCFRVGFGEVLGGFGGVARSTLGGYIARQEAMDQY